MVKNPKFDQAKNFGGPGKGLFLRRLSLVQLVNMKFYQILLF